MASLSPCGPSSATPTVDISSPHFANKRPSPFATTPGREGDPENGRKVPKVSRACDVCKKRKIRCNGTLPCTNCVKRSIHCAYNASYGRGRPPTPPLSAATDEQRSGQLNNPATHNLSEQAHQAQVDIVDEDYPCQNHSSTSPEEDTEAYVDPTSGLNFLHRAWKKLLTQKDDTNYGSNGLEKHQLLAHAGDRPFRVDKSALEADFVPDALMAKSLLDFYFNTCVVTYRMLHRPTVEKWMAVFNKNQEEQRPVATSLGPARTAILLAIMAIAAFRSEIVKREFSNDNEALALRKSDQLFHNAMELTDMEVSFPRLESVQARLVQVIYLLQTSRMNKGWYTLGHTFQMTLSLGMHRRRDQKRDLLFSNGGRQDYITSECVKRTFWVAYIIDRYLSVVFGRPHFYQDEDIDQHFPDSANDEDMTMQGYCISDDPEDCYVDALIYHAKIARIIGRISRAVYTVNDMSNYDRQSAAYQLELELQQWRASLPPYLGAVRPSTLSPNFRRQAIALQLAYSHAIIHVNRPFILSHELPENVEKCIAATQDILRLVDKMAGDTVLFHSFWWTHYVSFCALAVVYVCEIQKSRCSTNCADNFLFNKVLDLAEKCQGHLKRTATGLSQSHRYAIILGELRSEAQSCRFIRETGLNPLQSLPSELITSAEANFRPLHGTEITGVSGPEFSARDGFSPNALDSFIFSDWLTLDSSVFFPLFDPESTSPLSFTMVR